MSAIEKPTSRRNHDRANEPHYDFDWDGLERSIGEAQPDLTKQDRAELALAVAKIFDFALAVDMTRKEAPRLVGRRFIALAWIMDPSRFEGASIRKLSRQLSMTAPNLSKLTAAASRAFGLSNRFQSHDWKKQEAA